MINIVIPIVTISIEILIIIRSSIILIITELYFFILYFLLVYVQGLYILKISEQLSLIGQKC